MIRYCASKFLFIPLEPRQKLRVPYSEIIGTTEYCRNEKYYILILFGSYENSMNIKAPSNIFAVKHTTKSTSLPGMLKYFTHTKILLDLHAKILHKY